MPSLSVKHQSGGPPRVVPDDISLIVVADSSIISFVAPFSFAESRDVTQSKQ